MSVSASFFQRDFTLPTAVTPPLAFQVRRYSKRARGGCFEATIDAAGSREDLWRLLDWGRYRVEISNDSGDRVWWGYVREVEVRDGSVTARVSVDDMSNRVAVAYTLTANGQANTGSRGTTEYAEDAYSVKEFGRKELLESQGGISEAAALAKRGRVLADRKYPVGFAEISPVSAGNTDAPAATITCEGWWWSLDWQYCNVPTQLVAAFETIGTTDQTVGESTVIRLAQTFEVGATAWNILQVGVYAKRTGVPADNLSVAITELDEDGNPGSSVASGTLEPASLTTDYAWTLVTLSSAAALTAGTRYAVQISFSGTPDAANYYSFKLDAAQGYAGGGAKQYDTDWSDAGADMPFRLQSNALVATDVQILNIARAYGQFFRKVAMVEATGVTMESYRNGDNDALYELEDLLDIGNSDGARLLAEVDHARQVRIYPMEEETAAEVCYLRRDGNFYRRNTERLSPSTCPVGFWARQADIVPSGVDISRITGLSAFFVEEMEYDADADRLYYRPLGSDDIWNIGTKAG